MNNPVAGIFVFITGSVFASFFGVVICRVPKGLSIAFPGSHCFECGRSLSWYENIPIISWLLSGGKCRSCGAEIGVFSLIYEILGGAVPLIVYHTADNLRMFIVFSLLSMLLLLLGGYDFENREISTLFGIRKATSETGEKPERPPYFAFASAILYIVIIIFL